MGKIQFFASSPKTCATFRLQPREKPFLSGPLEKTGALNASGVENKNVNGPRGDVGSCGFESRSTLTYGGSVLPDEPQVVTEQRQDADEEHGRHEKQKQDVEFGVCVWKLFLKREKIQSYTGTQRTCTCVCVCVWYLPSRT